MYLGHQLLFSKAGGCGVVVYTVRWHPLQMLAFVLQLHEEAGVTAPQLHHRGVLTFVFDDQPVPWEVHGEDD